MGKPVPLFFLASKTSMSKPRPNTSSLMTMPREQTEALGRWLTVENLTYEQAQIRLKKEFGIKASKTRLSVFYQRFCSQRLVRPSDPSAGASVPLVEIIMDFSRPQFVRVQVNTRA